MSDKGRPTKAQCEAKITEARRQLQYLRQSLRTGNAVEISRAVEEVELTHEEAVGSVLSHADLGY